MLVTESYIDVPIGTSTCMFFLLYEDYHDRQQALRNGVQDELDAFGQRLGKHAALVAPYADKVGETRRDVLGKNWPKKMTSEIMNTPSLLMIDVDFDTFDPSRHRWVHIRLDRLEDGRLQSTLRQVVDLVKRASKLAIERRELFDAVQETVDRPPYAHIARNVRVGIPGSGISLSAGDLLDLFKGLSRRPK